MYESFHSFSFCFVCVFIVKIGLGIREALFVLVLCSFGTRGSGFTWMIVSKGLRPGFRVRLGGGSMLLVVLGPRVLQQTPWIALL